MFFAVAGAAAWWSQSGAPRNICEGSNNALYQRARDMAPSARRLCLMKINDPEKETAEGRERKGWPARKYALNVITDCAHHQLPAHRVHRRR